MRKLPFIFLFCLPSLLFSQEETSSSIATPSFSYHLQQEADTLKLPALSWILEEGKTHLTGEQLFAGEQADAKFIELKESPKFNLKANHPYWYKIRLTTAAQIEDYGMALYRTGNCWPFEQTYSEIESYIQDKNGKIKTGHSGNSSPGSVRDYPKHLLPSILQLDLQPNDTVDIWCKVIMAVSCNMQVDMELVKEDLIQGPRAATAYFNTQNFIRGAMIVLLFMATLLFLWFRERVYLWFLLFILASLLFGIVRDFRSEIFFLFFSESPKVIPFLHTTLATLMFCALMYFGRVYVNTEERFPKTHLTIGIGIVGMLLLSIIGNYFRFFPHLSAEFIPLLKRLLSFVIISSISIGLLSLAFSRDKLAQFFSIGALLPIVALLIGVVEIYINKTNFSLNVPLIMSGGISLTMALAMAYRVKLEIDAKQKALQEKAQAEIEQSKQQQQLLLAAEQAKQSGELDAMKSNFFANVTHEFRTPLTLILEPVRQLLKKETDKENTQKLFLVKNNSEKMLGLVNQLLDVSKIEDGKMKINFFTGVPSETIRPIFQSFLLLADKKGIKLKMRSDKNQQPVFFDKIKLEKIIFNLLSNAVKYTKAGQVELDVKIIPQQKDTDQLHIQVKDTGIGIAEKDLLHIFDRFHQVDASTIRTGEGTGIGLALVKELVGLMKGGLSVDSEPDKGSCFKIWLPVPSEEEEVKTVFGKKVSFSKQQEKTADIQLSQNLQSEFPQNTLLTETPTINTSYTTIPENETQPVLLLVEDNHELRHFVKQTLEKNYRVLEASNGEEGTKIAQQIIPDLIISDVMMPKKDGFALTHELKNQELTAHIPIILLTAKTTTDSKLQGLKTGADAYLTKPFNTEELMIRIEKLIELRKQLQRKYTFSVGIHEKDGTTKPNHSKLDEQFIKKTLAEIYEGLPNPDFSVELLASKLFISRSQLFRKLKALTGTTPIQFIRNARLDRAKELLLNKEGNVNEVSEKVGFLDDRYFSTKFKERFGVSPSEV